MKFIVDYFPITYIAVLLVIFSAGCGSPVIDGKVKNEVCAEVNVNSGHIKYGFGETSDKDEAVVSILFPNKIEGYVFSGIILTSNIGPEFSVYLPNTENCYGFVNFDECIEHKDEYRNAFFFANKKMLDKRYCVIVKYEDNVEGVPKYNDQKVIIEWNMD